MLRFLTLSVLFDRAKPVTEMERGCACAPAESRLHGACREQYIENKAWVRMRTREIEVARRMPGKNAMLSVPGVIE